MMHSILAAAPPPDPACSQIRATRRLRRARQGLRAGGGGLGSGFVVDVTLRRALVCRAPPA